MIPLRLAIIAICFLGINFCMATNLTNISCVGDSITAGVGVINPSADSYPARLQKLLGTNYVVGNFGTSGATLLKNGDTPYWTSANYFVSHGRSVSTAPNIVIIMLGSNDSKPQNWVYGSNFVSDYQTLVATYVTNHLLQNPRILICTPPPVFNNGTANIDPGIVATNISPLIRALGTNLDLQVIDFQTLLAGHSEWFPDNVHPNTQGTTVMAAIVNTALLGDTLDGSSPGIGISAFSNTTAVLNWPSNGAGWVLQSTPSLGTTNIWMVVGLPAINNGTSVLVTNSPTSLNAMFRLWNPSAESN
jgi:lysophospholipase L1-like esterase